MSAAVDYTITNNPDVGIDARHRRSVDEALIGAYSGYLPSIDLGWGTGRERANNASTRQLRPSGPYGDNVWSRSLHRHERSATLQWNIFQSLGTWFEVERNKARMQSAAHRVAGTSDAIALRVVEAYIDVLRMRETVRLTKQNLDNHQKTYDQIQVRAQSGIGRRSDLDQAEARLSLAKSNLISAEANLRDVEIAYVRFVGKPADELIQPDFPAAELFPPDLETAQEAARQGNPLLKQSIADIEAANAQYNAAKSPFGPRLDIEAGITNVDNGGGIRGSNDDRYAMLRARWNIFRGGADMARLGETKQLSYEAMEINKRTLMQLEQSTALSWNTLTSVRERLPSLKQHAESALATRDAYALQFSIGQRTLIDLLDTENEYFTSTIELTNGQYLELFAAYRLLADMGAILPVLGVQPLVDSDATQRVGWTNPWVRNDYGQPLKQIPVAQQEAAQPEEVALVPEDSEVEVLEVEAEGT
jgi:adhesin transport system outer membrane protein